MKCFNHPYRDTVAVCSSCGRALCSQCAVPAQNDRIACLNRCEAEVMAMGSYVVIPKEKKSYTWKILVLILLAVASVVTGFLDRYYHWTDYSHVWFGVSFAFLLPFIQLGLPLLAQKWAVKSQAKKLKRGKENQQ